jgi:formylglycine-generating enzyme required for sulfatase activity
MITAENCPEGFVLIKAGQFTMGSLPSEQHRGSDETKHLVEITRDFYLQTTPVTRGQWHHLIGNNPSYFTQGGDECPVESVNWYEALSYLNALSESEGLEPYYRLTGCRGVLGWGCGGGGYYPDGYVCYSVESKGLDCEGYRLPTEAEWEYAARAGSLTAYYSGGNIKDLSRTDPNLAQIGWYYKNSKNKVHPVACKEPNAWGLYDMLGNVFEWVWDRYDYYYPSEPVTDPEGPGTGARRVYRGGSWISKAPRARSAARGWVGPIYRSNVIGFRAARTVKY